MKPINSLICCLIIAFTMLQTQAEAQLFGRKHNCRPSICTSYVSMPTVISSSYSYVQPIASSYSYVQPTGQPIENAWLPQVMSVSPSMPTGLPVWNPVQPSIQLQSQPKSIASSNESTQDFDPTRFTPIARTRRVYFLRQSVDRFGNQFETLAAVDACEPCYSNCLADPNTTQEYCGNYCKAQGGQACPAYPPAPPE